MPKGEKYHLSVLIYSLTSKGTVDFEMFYEFNLIDV
jgi:hypothetical protein